MDRDTSTKSGPSHTEGSPADAVDRLLDLFVFAPIGLALEARNLAPELAERGRRQVEMARVLGAQAARFGAARVDGPARQVMEAMGLVPPRAEHARVVVPPPAAPTDDAAVSAGADDVIGSAGADDVIGSAAADDVIGSAGGELSPTSDDVPGSTEESDTRAPEAPELAIEDYDSLAASHVVKRLDGLSPAELEAVRAHEAATRGRRTILAKIARLQA